jgi:hypothetical protein
MGAVLGGWGAEFWFQQLDGAGVPAEDEAGYRNWLSIGRGGHDSVVRHTEQTARGEKARQPEPQVPPPPPPAG